MPCPCSCQSTYASSKISRAICSNVFSTAAGLRCCHSPVTPILLLLLLLLLCETTDAEMHQISAANQKGKGRRETLDVLCIDYDMQPTDERILRPAAVRTIQGKAPR